MAVDSLKKKNKLENIYILSNEGGKERILVLSDTPDDFGTDYSFSPEMKEALTTNKETVSDVYEDESAPPVDFSAAENGSGEKVGILGIDLDASVIPETAAKAKWYTIAISAFVLLLGMVMAYFLGSYIAKPIRQLMKAYRKNCRRRSIGRHFCQEPGRSRKACRIVQADERKFTTIDWTYFSFL